MADKGDVQKTIESFATMLKASDLKKTGDDLVAAFAALVAAYRAFKADTEDERVKRDREFSGALTSLRKSVDARLGELRGTDGKDGKNGFNGAMGPSGPRGEKGGMGEKGKDGADGSPDSADDIRNKLELLDGQERLKIEAIRDLREELDLLEEKINKKVILVPTGGGGGGTSSGGMQVYNISSQLNGVLKTFSLPAFQEIFFILSTSSPTPAMIPAEDFTVDYTTMQITFGASIDATTTLSAGQRIIVAYA